MCLGPTEALSHEGSLHVARSSASGCDMHWFQAGWDRARQLLRTGYHQIFVRMHRRNDL